MARPRSEEARRKALAAATDLIVERGVSQLTIEEVASRSGVAKTTIYRHWPSAETLLIDALACQVEQLPTPNTGTIRGDLRAMFELLIPTVDRTDKARLIFGLLYAAADDLELRRSLTDLMRERINPLRTIVELARARGELPASLDIDDAIDLIEGPFFYRYMFRGEEFDPDGFEILLEHVLRGLGA